MSYLNRNYSFVKQENFDGFLRAVGIPEEKIEQVLKFSLEQKLTRDGDIYTYHTRGFEGPKEVKFEPAVDFDAVIGPENTPIKTIYAIADNIVYQTINFSRGCVVITKEYTGDDLVVTLTSDLFNGVAKRFYKAV